MASTILARMKASKSVLAAISHTKAFASVSKSEAQHMKELLGMQTLDYETISHMCGEVKSAGFAPGDRDFLLEELAALLGSAGEMPPAASTCMTRAKQQNFEEGVRYISTELWEELEETGDTNRIFELYAKLGLRCFTEGTMQVLGLMVLCMTEGVERVKAMEASMRTGYIKGFKASYKTIVQHMPPPPLLL